MRADKVNGEFRITGLEGSVSGMFDSHDDVSIPMTARYYTNGEPHELAHELQIAGGGVMVGVY